MKIAFFMALLVNILLFLWEYLEHGPQHQAPQTLSNPDPKQIFLVSELSPAQLALLQQAGQGKSPRKAEIQQPTAISVYPLASSLADYAENNPSRILYENKAFDFSTISLLNPLKNNPSQQRHTTQAMTAPVTLTKTPDSSAYILPEEAVLATSKNEHKVDSTKESAIQVQEQPPTLVTLENPDAQPAATNVFCYEVGPFPSKRAFKKWQQLSNLPIISSQTITKMDRSSGKYMVYVPAAETYELSRQNLELLKKQGIKDTWLFAEGENKGNISLGMFQDNESALQFQQQLLLKGVNVLIKKHLRNRPIPAIFAQINVTSEWSENTNPNELLTIEKCPP